MTARGTIPLGLEAYKRGFNPEVELINFIIEEDRSGASPDKVMRLKRPGLVTMATGPGVVRGLFQQGGVFADQVFGVFGPQFSSVGSEVSALGTVPGTDAVAMAATFEQIALVGNGIPYSWNGAVFATVAMPDARTVIDTETINGYVIYACPDGRFYWVVPGETDPDPLNFATAESSPDGLVGVCRLGDELWFFGTASIEVWQTTGSADAPFQRAPGRQYDRGCLSRDTILRFDNTLFWVGEDRVVYRAGNVPQRVSEFGVEERIRLASDTVTAMTFQMLEHKFYALRIPGQATMCYDPSSNGWSRMATGADPLWDAAFYAGGMFGSASSGAVTVDSADAYSDDGFPIRCVVSGTAALVGRPDRFDSMTVGCGSTGDFTLQIRWKDGQDDYPEFSEELYCRAPYDTPSLYRMGTPDLPSRTYEILIEEPVGVRLSGAMLGTGWQ